MKKLKFKASVKSILLDLKRQKSRAHHFKQIIMAMMTKEATIKLWWKITLLIAMR